MATVHLDSSGDRLARGMSWPLNTTTIVGLMTSRSEQEIWLSVRKSDRVKEWAGRSARGRSSVQLAAVEFRESWVRLRFWSYSKSSRKPEWFELDDPALILCYIDGLPSYVMKETGLTRKLASSFVDRMMKELMPTSLTGGDWRISIHLAPGDRALTALSERCPTRKWERERERCMSIEEVEAWTLR